MSFFPFRCGAGGKGAVCLGASAPQKSWGACVWRGEAETRPTVSGWGMVPIFPELSSSVFPSPPLPSLAPVADEYRCLLCREANHIPLGKSPSWSTMEWLGLCFLQRHCFFSRSRAVRVVSSRRFGKVSTVSVLSEKPAPPCKMDDLKPCSPSPRAWGPLADLAGDKSSRGGRSVSSGGRRGEAARGRPLMWLTGFTTTRATCVIIWWARVVIIPSSSSRVWMWKLGVSSRGLMEVGWAFAKQETGTVSIPSNFFHLVAFHE